VNAAGPGSCIERAMNAAQVLGHAEGERVGYLQGARDGRIAGFCWGLIVGAFVAAGVWGLL